MNTGAFAHCPRVPIEESVHIEIQWVRTENCTKIAKFRSFPAVILDYFRVMRHPAIITL